MRKGYQHPPAPKKPQQNNLELVLHNLGYSCMPWGRILSLFPCLFSAFEYMMYGY